MGARVQDGCMGARIHNDIKETCFLSENPIRGVQ